MTQTIDEAVSLMNKTASGDTGEALAKVLGLDVKPKGLPVATKLTVHYGKRVRGTKDGWVAIATTSVGWRHVDLKADNEDDAMAEALTHFALQAN